MPLSQAKKGKRFALPFFSLGLAALSAANPVAAQTRSTDLPPVLRQRFDDDCGLTGLQMLLQRAGLDVRDEALLAGLKSPSGVDALTAADLADMVAALNLNIQLEIGYLPLETAAALASQEPFLILMKPDARTGLDAIDHFILVEGRVNQGFTVADPVLPERVQLSDGLFAKDVHGKSIDGRPFAMVLRLTRNADPIAQQLPVGSVDQRLQSWEQAYRLPRLLPPGKVQISLFQLRQEERVFAPNLARTIAGSTDATLLNVARGIGGRSQVSLSLARISGSGGFKRPGETFDFDRTGSFDAALSIDHVPDLALPPSVAVTTFASVEWSDKLGPSAAVVGGSLIWTDGYLAAGIDTDLRYDRRFFALLTPNISYRLPTKAGFVIEGELAVPYRVGANRPAYEMQLSVSRQIGLDWQIGAFVNSSLFESRGERYRQIGIGLTYGVPRRFRRR